MRKTSLSVPGMDHNQSGIHCMVQENFLTKLSHQISEEYSLGLNNFHDPAVHIALKEEPGDRKPFGFLTQLLSIYIKYCLPVMDIIPTSDGRHSLVSLQEVAEF